MKKSWPLSGSYSGLRQQAAHKSQTRAIKHNLSECMRGKKGEKGKVKVQRVGVAI